MSARTARPSSPPRAFAPALLCLLCAAAGGCLGRAQDLLDDVNAQLIITGSAPGDALSVSVGEERWDVLGGEEDPIVVYLSLPPGSHDGEVRVRRQPARCASFTVTLADERSSDVVSVDLRDAVPCEPGADGGGGDPDAGFDAGQDAGAGVDAGQDGDAGSDTGSADDAGFDAGVPQGGDAGPDPPPLVDVFLHLEEGLTVDPCLELLCLQVTRVEADGRVFWLDLVAAEVSALVPLADVAALAAATLSEEADALFAGEDPDCPQPRPLGVAGIELERRYLPAGEATAVIETVGVAGCSGVADELRARLAFLRQLALGL